MNACDDEKEYNCADGCCVAIEERCNGKNDCPDGSDEQARSNGLGAGCQPFYHYYIDDDITNHVMQLNE